MRARGVCVLVSGIFSFFFFNDTATTEIYTLSLHDALPILFEAIEGARTQSDDATARHPAKQSDLLALISKVGVDRKSTRLNSSHSQISYAVFCLKKKKHHPTSPTAHTGPISCRERLPSSSY